MFKKINKKVHFWQIKIANSYKSTSKINKMVLKSILFNIIILSLTVNAFIIRNCINLAVNKHNKKVRSRKKSIFFQA